ncbi:MAG TPA: hypothetical protein ACFYEI_10165 [Candidatus Tripitaka californicus]|uniref:hypothetical protein n=1 Tax=Candidatus Tripitaka californicus TaxID=3367616 RepID=UPI004025B693
MNRFKGSLFTVLLAMAGFVLLESHVAFADPGPATFQEVASQVFGQGVGKCDTGDLYIFGLTSNYVPPEYVDGRGPYKSFLKFIPVVRWYDPENYWVNKNSVEVQN